MIFVALPVVSSSWDFFLFHRKVWHDNSGYISFFSILYWSRNDAEAETPVLWPPHAKSWLTGKTLMLGGIGGRRRKGRQRMRWLDWHHWLDGRESEWTLGVGDGQGGLACCDSWGRKESDTTERLNWTELIADLKSCDSFRCTTEWLTHTYTCIPFSPKLSRTGWHITLSRVPSAIQ